MKLDQLTFTRFLAAIAIVVYHFGLKVYPFNNAILHAVFANAAIFVSYFFILSGFVMVIASSKREGQQIDYTTYYVNRFARIYPLYILALLIVVAPHIMHLNMLSFTLQATLLQAWVPGYAMRGNVAGWSLSVEAFFYLLFPLLFNKFYSLYNKKYVFIAILIFIVLCYVATTLLALNQHINSDRDIKHDLFGAFPLFRLGEFLLGNALGLIFIKIPPRYFKNHDLPLIIVFVLIILSLIFKQQLLFIPYLYWVLFSAFILLLALNKTGIITRIFSHKYMVLLGEISYGVYILQFPVWSIRYFINHIGLKNAVTNNFFFITAILIFVSYLTYRFIEIPGREYIRSFYTSKRNSRQNRIA